MTLACRLAVLPALLALSVPPLLRAQIAPPPKPPLVLVSQTYLPEVVGDFDHFAVDLKRNHLFVSAEDHHSVEMFDLRSGHHLQSLGGFKTPHSLAFSSEQDLLMVCDGGASELVLVSGQTLQPETRIPLVKGTAGDDSPDAAFYDPATRLYYIGNGGASAKQEISRISIFSVDQHKLVGEFEVPGNNVESIGVDDLHDRLYVNIRDKKQVGVYDLKTRKLLTTWNAPGLNRNTALLVDAKNQRIFVAGRTPGMLVVFDQNGKVVAQKPCTERNDDMSFDPVTRLLYISGTQGLSVFHQDTPDTYTEITRIPTNGGKTSILVPQLRLLFVAHPKTDVDIAGLLVYRLNR
jgi:hypothetical protein